MKEFLPEIRKKYMQQVCNNDIEEMPYCPFCGYEDTECGSLQFDQSSGGRVIVDVWCNGCNKKWNENYIFDKITPY